MKRILFFLLLISSLAKAQVANNYSIKSLNLLRFGAKGDAQTFSDGVVNGSTTFTSATASFVSADAGKLFIAWGVGVAGADLVTTIASVSNSTTVILTNAATATGSAKTFYYGTDNTTAIQNMATATVSTGTLCHIPMGKYLNRGGINFPYPVQIIGEASSKREGAWDSTHTAGDGPVPQTVFWTVAVNQDLIRLQGHGSFVQFMDFANVTSATPTSGALVKANGSQTSFENCHFLNGYYGIQQTNSVGWHAAHCVFLGNVFAQIYVNNLNAPDNGDYNITGCLFQSGFVNGLYGIRIQSSGGVRILNNKFNTGLTTPISLTVTGSGNSSSDFIVGSNSLENYTGRGVEIVMSSSATWSAIDISHNQFFSATATAKAIYLSGGITGGIANGVINGNNFRFTASTDTCLYLKNVSDFVVGSNIMYAGNLAMYVDATCVRTSEVSAVISSTGIMALKAPTIYTLDVGGSTIQKVFSNLNQVYGTTTTDQGYNFQWNGSTNGAWTGLLYNASQGAAAYSRLVFQCGTASAYITETSNGFSGSPSIMSIQNPSNGILFVGSYVEIPKLNFTGTSSATVGLYNAAFGNTNYADLQYYPQSGTNVTSRIFISPKGTGNAGDLADLVVSNKDFVADGTNIELFKIQTTGTQTSLYNIAAGTGTVRPLVLYTGSNTDQLKLNIDGSVSTSGGEAHAYRAITALRTLDATDFMINCTANSFTVTLPTAVGITGREYIIKNTGSATTITIATTSAQTIDGAAPGTVTTLVPLRVMSNGANWITF